MQVLLIALKCPVDLTFDGNYKTLFVTLKAILQLLIALLLKCNLVMSL